MMDREICLLSFGIKVCQFDCYMMKCTKGLCTIVLSVFVFFFYKVGLERLNGGIFSLIKSKSLKLENVQDDVNQVFSKREEPKYTV